MSFYQLPACSEKTCQHSIKSVGAANSFSLKDAHTCGAHEGQLIFQLHHVHASCFLLVFDIHGDFIIYSSCLSSMWVIIVN